MIKKSRDEILRDLEARLVASTDITNSSPGSVARTFMEVLTEEFYEFYDNLELSATMGFVSTAYGRYLDLIGTLLDCRRELGETDDNYRARITQQVYVVAGANMTSIRLKALSVEGVKDVILREFTHGTGSFSCYVITEENDVSSSILRQVQAAVEEAKAFGISAEVTTPVLLPIDLMVRLVFSSDTGSAEKETIRANVFREVRDYINNLSLGEEFIVNELIQRIMDASGKIKDLDIYSLKVNGISRYILNAESRWNERFVLGRLDIS